MKPFAFVFPGQGSQSVGMLDAWADHPAVKATLEEASQALGEDVAGLIHNGPKETLDLTTNTQPVMLTAAIACYRAWLADGGPAPVAVAGHSLGEYSALVAAGALSLSDALPLVRFRAQAMQEAVPVGAGAMAAILGLDAAVVKDVCAQAAAASGQAVEAANFNDPKQTVIAGTKAGVDKACEMLKAAGAKRALPLAVSAPFHSSLMNRPLSVCVNVWLRSRSKHLPLRWSTTSMPRWRTNPTPSAMRSTAKLMAPCGGWKWCKRFVPEGSTTSWNAARARCCQGWSNALMARRRA